MTAIEHILDDPFRISVLLSAVYIPALIICVTVFLLDRRRNHRLNQAWAGVLVAETESFLAIVASAKVVLGGGYRGPRRVVRPRHPQGGCVAGMNAGTS